MVENAVVYLVGHPGVGKLTIARLLAPLLAARVVDNHWINNPIFGLLDNDRVTPFSLAIWDQVDKVRDAVLETVATLCSPTASFIFTHAGSHDDPDDRAIYRAFERAAKRRRALFVPVRLLCSEDELAKRIVSPERAARMKSMDVQATTAWVRSREVLKTGHAGELTLDTSAIDPQESASLIERHVAVLARTR